MEVVHFIYQGKEVDFLPSGNENLMVNATQMAKLFGKDLFQFTKSDNTKEFIKACLKPANAGLLGVKTEEDLIISRQKSGTWMHRILALKFAAWLDPEFEVWVFTTIDKIILGHYKEIKEATTAKFLAERALEAKKQELMEQYPEFADFLEIEGKISEAEKRRLKAFRASTAQLRLDLFQNQ
jgi:hypothetical protein